jgi:hypothetical protein
MAFGFGAKCRVQVKIGAQIRQAVCEKSTADGRLRDNQSLRLVQPIQSKISFELFVSPG